MSRRRLAVALTAMSLLGAGVVVATPEEAAAGVGTLWSGNHHGSDRAVAMATNINGGGTTRLVKPGGFTTGIESIRTAAAPCRTTIAKASTVYWPQRYTSAKWVNVSNSGQTTTKVDC